MVLDFGSGLKLDNCSLYMAGQGGAVLPANTSKNAYSLLCVKFGSLQISCSEGDFTLTSGDAVLMLPEEKKDFVSVSDDLSYDLVVFSADSKRYSDIFFTIKQTRSGFASRVFLSKNLEDTAERICAELELRHSTYSNEMLSLLCNQMILYIARIFELDPNDKKENNELNEKVCARVMKLVDSRIFSMKNLREIASEMGYNYSYISSLFHKTTGVTLNAYFKNKRMTEAKKLLSDSKMTISEIARMMNYSSVYAFSKAFKEHCGVSPGHYSGRFSGKE